MNSVSSIEWTDATWNPVRGCSRVSEGCRNCYAERIAARFSDEGGVREVYSNNAWVRVFDDALPFAGFAGQTDAGPRWTGRVELVDSLLDWPLRRRKPQRIFVNSMSDLFHEKLSNEAIAAVFGAMAACPQHTFQILTKRPERMANWFRTMSYMPLDHTDFEVRQCIGAFDRHTSVDARKHVNYPSWPLPNVWLGTSVENQATADERIPHLLATPAARRFVSYEPALGPVRFQRWLLKKFQAGWDEIAARFPQMQPPPQHLGRPDDGLDWVIVGGESGPGARPFDVAWARSTVEQCKAAGVACFVKQLGALPRVVAGEEDVVYLSGVHYREDSVRLGEKATLHLRDRKGGDWKEWPIDLRVREFPR